MDAGDIIHLVINRLIKINWRFPIISGPPVKSLDSVAPRIPAVAMHPGAWRPLSIDFIITDKKRIL
jgi:hypothetical protein